MATAKFKFTKERIDGLPRPRKGEGWKWHRATQVRGLQLGVGPVSKTFYLVRKINGKPERIRIGPYPDVTIERAIEKAEKLNAEVADGKNPAELRREHRGELTLGALFREYIANHAIPHGVRTVPAMKDNFARYLGDLGEPVKKKRGRLRTKAPGSVNWEQRKLSHITHDDVDRLHIALGEHCGHYAANRTIELISALFRYAGWKKLWKGENPAANIKPFKEVKRDRFLQSGELPRFFAALAAESNEALRNFFLLSILTGARRSNVLSMKWSDIDDARAVWKIPAADAKAGEPIDVTLVPEAIALLKEQSARAAAYAQKHAQLPSPYVFPGHGATGHLASPKTAWRRVLKRAKIDDLRIHDLRRSLGSWQAILGASLPIIGRSLGHKSPSATANYAHLSADPVRESVERATSAMLVAGGLKPAAVVSDIRERKTRRRRPAGRSR